MPIKKTLSLAVTLFAVIGLCSMMLTGGRATQYKAGLEAQAKNGKKAKGFDRQINVNMEQIIDSRRGARIASHNRIGAARAHSSGLASAHHQENSGSSSAD